jgi:hypothetical protein
VLVLEGVIVRAASSKQHIAFVIGTYANGTQPTGPNP